MKLIFTQLCRLASCSNWTVLGEIHLCKTCNFRLTSRNEMFFPLNQRKARGTHAKYIDADITILIGPAFDGDCHSLLQTNS